jgi:hypothetical protein
VPLVARCLASRCGEPLVGVRSRGQTPSARSPWTARGAADSLAGRWSLQRRPSRLAGVRRGPGRLAVVRRAPAPVLPTPSGCAACGQAAVQRRASRVWSRGGRQEIGDAEMERIRDLGLLDVFMGFWLGLYGQARM